MGDRLGIPGAVDFAFRPFDLKCAPTCLLVLSLYPCMNLGIHDFFPIFSSCTLHPVPPTPHPPPRPALHATQAFLVLLPLILGQWWGRGRVAIGGGLGGMFTPSFNLRHLVYGHTTLNAPVLV